jgi:hypothetical protein
MPRQLGKFVVRGIPNSHQVINGKGSSGGVGRPRMSKFAQFLRRSIVRMIAPLAYTTVIGGMALSVLFAFLPGAWALGRRKTPDLE